MILLVRGKEESREYPPYVKSIALFSAVPNVAREDLAGLRADYVVVMSSLVVDIAEKIGAGDAFRSLVEGAQCTICVGPSTKLRVGRCVVPRRYSSRGVENLLDSLEPGEVVVLRSAHGSPLRTSHRYREVHVYRLELSREAQEELRRRLPEASAVIVTSPMVASALISIAEDERVALPSVVAIGEATAAVLRAHGIPHSAPERYTIDAAIDLARRMLGMDGP